MLLDKEMVKIEKIIDQIITKMRKLKYYIFTNIRHIINIMLVSVIFSFWIFPFLVNSEIVKNFLMATAKEPFIAITTALILLFIINSWARAQSIWQRYKNIHKLEKPPFVYINYIVLFIIFSFILIALFQSKSIPNISLEFKVLASLNFIFIIGWFLSSYFWKKKKEEQEISNIDTYSLSDESIQFDKQDLLGREKFIGDLYKEITNLPFTDPFIFGLYGSWGEGKTSVINLLSNKLKENENFLIVNFDPWHFKDEKAILAAFYNQVEQGLNQRFIFPGLKKTFIRYQKLISMGLAQAGIKIDFSSTKESLEEIRQRIESYIAQTKKKIIIFIDDIDRLQSREILLIFKLVRLNANFKNTIFLLSFDPNIVKEYLKDNLKVDPEFLEKIVQKPVQIPAIEQADIDKFLDFHMDKLFDEISISKETREKFNEKFPTIYLMQIRKLFKTLRHAKRYLNGMRSTLPSIKNEIYLYDFFILEIIRIFFPKVYKDVWLNPWFYIPLDWSGMNGLLSPFTFINIDEKYSQIKKHLEDVINNENVNETKKEVLKELLKEIFFVEAKNALNDQRDNHSKIAGDYRAEKRITHPESFKKYFMLKVSSLEISDESVEITLNSWHSTVEMEKESIIEKTIIELQKKEKLLEFFKKLMIFINAIEKETAFYIIRVIYKNANKFSKKRIGYFWNSEYDEALRLLLWLINDKIEKNKIQDILEEVVMGTSDLPCAIRVVKYCRKIIEGSLYNIYDSIKIEELQDKVANQLKTHFVDENRDIFDELYEEDDWGFVLYQWATNWETFKGDNNKIVNNYVFSIIKDDCKKFVKFLMYQRQRTTSDTLTFNLTELDRVYNLIELQKLAEKFKNESSLSIEKRGVIEMFLKLYEDKQKN